MRDSWAMTMEPQSEQNHYPMNILVFTAICKEMFYWLPNPNINVLLLSNLLLVYSMNWKESTLCFPFDKAVVFPEEVIVLPHSSGSLVVVVFTILKGTRWGILLLIPLYIAEKCHFCCQIFKEIRFYLLYVSFTSRLHVTQAGSSKMQMFVASVCTGTVWE